MAPRRKTTQKTGRCTPALNALHRELFAQRLKRLEYAHVCRYISRLFVINRVTRSAILLSNDYIIQYRWNEPIEYIIDRLVFLAFYLNCVIFIITLLYLSSCFVVVTVVMRVGLCLSAHMRLKPYYYTIPLSVCVDSFECVGKNMLY